MKKKNEVKKSKMNNKTKKRISIIAAVGVVVLIIGAYFLSQNKESSKEKTYTAYKITKVDPLTFKGQVEAKKTDAYYLDAKNGKISEITVDNNQKVSVGDVLYKYQNDDMQTTIDSAQRTLNRMDTNLANAYQNLATAQDRLQEARNDLDKAKRTDGVETSAFEQAVTGQEDAVTSANQAVASAQADYDDAMASLETAKSDTSTEVVASTEGIAVVDNNGINNAAVPAVTIVSEDTVVIGSASEYEYSRLAKDQEVTVTQTNDQTKVNGKIATVDLLPTSTSAAAGAATTSSTISYQFTVNTEKNLHYGFSVEISLPLDEIRVPEEAVLTEDDSEYVYLYEKGKAKKQSIKTANIAGYTVVTEGLKEGDKIISDPDDNIANEKNVVVN